MRTIASMTKGRTKRSRRRADSATVDPSSARSIGMGAVTRSRGSIAATMSEDVYGRKPSAGGADEIAETGRRPQAGTGRRALPTSRPERVPHSPAGEPFCRTLTGEDGA